jgi:hypothetical protein
MGGCVWNGWNSRCESFYDTYVLLFVAAVPMAGIHSCTTLAEFVPAKLMNATTGQVVSVGSDPSGPWSGRRRREPNNDNCPGSWVSKRDGKKHLM